MGLMKAVIIVALVGNSGLGCGIFGDEQTGEVEVQTAGLSSLQEARQRSEKRRQWMKERREKSDREAAQREKEWQEKLEREQAENKRRLEEWQERQKNNPPPKRKRTVRRFKWQSPAEERGRIWNVPKDESENAVLDAFLRVCISEADGLLQDCVGVWQVVQNIRQRNCNRGMVRKITECDDNGEETTLSAFRRAQGHVLGMMPPRNSRVRWISKISSDCDVPENWPHSDDVWISRYERRCQNIVNLGKHLMLDKLPPRIPGVPLRWLPLAPIAWGGRCESGKASCDDHIACARGLSRIPNLRTQNAFWCSPGRGGCSSKMDPVCHKLREKRNRDTRKRRGSPEVENLVSELDPPSSPNS